MENKIYIKINHPTEKGHYTTVLVSTSDTPQIIIEKLIKQNFLNEGIYRVVLVSKKLCRLLQNSKPLSDEGINSNSTFQLLLPEKEIPLSAMFLGPKAENLLFWKDMISEVFYDYAHWRKNYFPEDPSVITREDITKNKDFFDSFTDEMNIVLNELKQGFPFHSPRYLGHMLSGQTLPSVIGYFAGMLYNPNNVTDEAAPITVKKELEFGKIICKMVGYGKHSWAHICSGGTIANLEAFWVARQTQFMPLIIQDICKNNKWEFKILSPKIALQNRKHHEESISIASLTFRELLSLKPNESLYMPSKLIKFLHDKVFMDKSLKEIASLIKEKIRESKFNIKYKGFYSVLNEVKLKPVAFVPESAHYSIKKALNILGYGEDAIRKIPMGPNFRIDIDKLKDLLKSLKDDEYIIAVMVVAGTTEEGAVDPIHKVKWLRDEIEREKNMSFWLHVDAAWGGYIRTLFNTDYSQSDIGYFSDSSNFTDKVRAFSSQINIKGELHIDLGKGKAYRKKTIEVSWADDEVISAFMAINDADSITIDPHKLGYVPYPAGVIAFKNSLVTQLITQDASYISTSSTVLEESMPPEITAVGSYILEGSKPGAAALACWLSAKMIPLDLNHHGKIIRRSLLSAKSLAYYLSSYHKLFFTIIDKEFVEEGVFQDICSRPFMFKLLYNNIDTNVICFSVVPMTWENFEDEKNVNLKSAGWNLEKTNLLNNNIYKHFTINAKTRNTDRSIVMAQRFFLSKTELTEESYAVESIQDILSALNYKSCDYKKHGFFVMRSTIMNPWYYSALEGKNAGEKNMDYFREFLKELHYWSRSEIEKMDQNTFVK